MESDGNITLVGEVILFKPRVGKVNFAQTTSGLCAIIPLKNKNPQIYRAN